MTAILGISAFYHDSAAALLVDGEIVAAAQEERFSRRKHDERFPAGAVAYCLRQGGLTPADLSYVGYYEKPLLKFERLLETYLSYVPEGFASFRKAMPLWLKEKLFLTRTLRRGLGDVRRRRYVFVDHHESHAASAFFPSPFDESAILTLDGVGEWSTGAFGVGRGNELSLTAEMRFPHSLGLLYSAFTYYTGFTVNSGEYKLMGLAPYGQPRYAKLILDHLVDLQEDGSFRLDMSYFNYAQGLTMTSKKFERLFGGPPRKPDTLLTERDMDLAASIQKVTEQIVVRTARHVRAATGMKNLCLAGGVALNCVANSRILEESGFDRIWIQPAAGDAGGALGVAQFIWYQLLQNARTPAVPDGQRGSLLGPRFDDDEIAGYLETAGVPFRRAGGDEELCDQIAEAIAAGKVVGWFQGRMEFGPRALGARSILASPLSPDMQQRLNEIKDREDFRPVAPVVTEEDAARWFVGGDVSPFMLFVYNVAPDKADRIPAVRHVDGTARIQTVNRGQNALYYDLLKAFQKRTGVPVLVNTSFNTRSEPVVCTPRDAIECFWTSPIDALAIGSFLLEK